MTMWIAQSVQELRQRRRTLGGKVALVPTMGALHAGHVSLVSQARRLADHVLVSIFVNPAQFGPKEDFSRYPRPLEQDLAACRDAGVDGVFNPTVPEMYPAGIPAASLNVPDMAGELEGALRPGHFEGVCRVVLKLFNLVQPGVACFGQKDFQQLRIVQAMVADLNVPVDVIACPTVRESDGLAMSSRNVYLSADERKRAVGLSKALEEARLLVEKSGETDPAAVSAAMTQTMKAYHIEPDYAVVRHPVTLAKLDCIEPRLTGGVVALVAGRLGAVRLLDNALIAVTGTARL
jgi:pantoate--beta-alanine ligase